ncbi:hypothetical protein D3C84_983980 [compost metagenome]
MDGVIGRTSSVMVNRHGKRVIVSRDKRDAILRALPGDVRVQFVQRLPGQLILKVDKEKRADMIEMLERVDTLRSDFDVVLEWQASLIQSANGKRQLFVVGVD